MKKVLLVIVIATVMIAGCGAKKMTFTIEKEPVFENEVSSEFIVKVTESDVEKTGLAMQATLEMAKMDHGVIEVTFVDNGDGTYTGDVELPMAGEWIADIKAIKDGKEFENFSTFDVKER